MSAPPGFNENNSLLPDVNAQIHVMKGGGNTNKDEESVEEHIEFSESEQNILKEYDGLDNFSGPFKKEFLKQLNKSICTKDTGDGIILSSDCWAIQQYIQSLIHSAIKKANSSSKSLNTSKKVRGEEKEEENEEKEEEKDEEEEKEKTNNDYSDSLRDIHGKPNNTAFENNNSNTDSVRTTNGFGQAKGGSRKLRVNKKSNTYFRRLPTRRREKKNGTRKQKNRK
jgi:transcription elongation factor Elf1